MDVNQPEEVYGRLTVKYDTGRRTSSRGKIVHCVCACGNEIDKDLHSLRTGHTKSCGCLWVESVTKHGHYGTPEYTIWAGMIQRCTNIEGVSERNYVGRGIEVCDRWLNSFENFLADMGLRPGVEYSLDRTDNDGNYEPSNCRWATRKEQLNNRRNTIFVGYNNELLSLKQYATLLNKSYRQAANDYHKQLRLLQWRS